MLKGGIWKNSEDEILKAAVMKYGLNNWARIASLLTRKTPAQCKARWHEWLDPSVKKTEWSREEDEKLLHLSKIFPTQWKTIAPIVGRTAHQCQDRYEKLLDETQGRLVLDEHDPRKLRPGEIDPHPEIRPAKADAVDMDDDEKQMLQEARARLANVRGKKATRKAQEEMMEEVKRVAEQKKDRELRAAGVSVPSKRPRKGDIDYNKEILFETQPQAGVHVFGTEETPKPNISLDGLSAQKLEGLSRSQQEQHQRQQDKERIKQKRETETAEDILARAELEAVHLRKINKLSLPDVEDSESDGADDEENETSHADGIRASRLLRLLPGTENEVEIEAPDFDELYDHEDERLVPDMGEIVVSGKDVEELRYQTSQVVLRKLPRPKSIAIHDEREASRLIHEEAMKLLATDSLEHPVKGQRPNPTAERLDRREFSIHELKRARALVAEAFQEVDPIDPESISVPPEPELTPALEQRLRKVISTNRSRIRELTETARCIVGGQEEEIVRLDDEMRHVCLEIADIRRNRKALEVCIMKEDAESVTLIEDVMEKLKIEKKRNKEYQDKYLRLSSLVKLMNSRQL